ncbi:MAG: adenylyltransferase/cytidyltransferase family protein [Candidatus Nanohaloarchaea archaeon]|nr:adenylyltransferase/cytidyltransferase family protein [Candidatus Nanohaloarchaea archaeon]
MADDAFIIGRFQPLHKGHEDLIQYARDEYDRVAVITAEGRDQPSDRNPLTLEERDQLLDQVYEDTDDLTFHYLEDDNESLHRGEEAVTSLLGDQYDAEQLVCITGNENTIDALDNTYRIDSPPDNKYRDRPYRGGHIRERAASGREWRHGVSDEVASCLDDLGFEERITGPWE